MGEREGRQRIKPTRQTHFANHLLNHINASLRTPLSSASASLTTSALLSSDFILCAKHCVSFTKVLSSSPPPTLPRLTSALGESLMSEQEESRKKAVGAITESYKKAIEEGDLPEICRIVPLLGDLDLTEESVGSYCKYSTRPLVIGEEEAASEVQPLLSLRQPPSSCPVLNPLPSPQSI